MKATCSTSVIGNCFSLVIIMILTVTCTGCSENLPGNGADEAVSYENGNIITEFFKVYPAGTTIHAFGGDVILDFPRGTVATMTRYSIVSFPIEQLDMRGNNVMMRAVTLTNVTNQNTFAYPVQVMMRYDLCKFNMCQPGEESDLAIFKYIGDRHAFHKIEALGECCKDCSCKTVSGCIDACGSFVLVEI
jgi:hypothetical protein